MDTARKRYKISNEEIMACCVNCGALLTMESGSLATPDWYKETRFVHYCKECQAAQFEDYVDCVGVDMAFYLCCAAYNLPFVPEAVPSRRNVDGETWVIYLDNMKMLDQDVTDSGEPAAFSDGMTDLSVIFDGKVPQAPVFAGGLTTGRVAEKLEGTRAQRKNWGLEFKTAQYKELDRLYNIRMTRFKDSGVDLMLEFTLRELCKLQLRYSEAMAEGNSKKAKDMIGMIKTMEEGNLLRPKDEAPAEAKRVDTLIARMENAGIIKKGKLLTLKDVQEYIAKDHPHYAEGLDIVDQILALIENTQRINEGSSPLTTLPLSLQITPLFGELDFGMTEEQKRLIGDLGLTPIKREKGDGNGGG